MSKPKTGGMPQIIINKDMLRNLIPIENNRTDVSKTRKIAKNLVACCIKHRGFTDDLRDPEDVNVIL